MRLIDADRRDKIDKSIAGPGEVSGGEGTEKE